MRHYEIQIRHHGAWVRYIGFKPAAPRAMVDAAWASHCASGRRAARLVTISPDSARATVVSTKETS